MKANIDLQVNGEPDSVMIDMRDNFKISSNNGNFQNAVTAGLWAIANFLWIISKDIKYIYNHIEYMRYKS